MKTLLYIAILSLYFYTGQVNAQEYETNSVIVLYNKEFTETRNKVLRNGSRVITEKQKLSIEAVEKAKQKLQAREEKIAQLESGDVYLVNSDKVSYKELNSEFSQLSQVKIVEPDYKLHPRYKPTDKFYYPASQGGVLEGQWYLRQLGMEKVWDMAENNAQTYVAILDSGISSHIDLKGKVVFTGDCNQSLSCTQEPGLDDSGHGTAIAGIVGAIHNNGGVAGLDKNSNLMSFRIWGRHGNSHVSSAIAAINYILKNFQDKKIIVNMSWGTDRSQILETAINEGFNQGLLFIAAAANDAGNGPDYPNGYQNVIGVGSINKQNSKTSYTHTGLEWVDILTYGGECGEQNQQDCLIVTKIHYSDTDTEINDKNLYTTTWYGNSLASPVVAATASIVWQTNPNLTNKQVVTILYNTTLPIEGTGTLWKYGRLNPYQAVKTAKNYRYDANGDANFNVFDLVDYVDNFTEGTLTYNPNLDYNNDNKNDVFDILVLLDNLLDN